MELDQGTRIRSPAWRDPDGNRPIHTASPSRMQRISLRPFPSLPSILNLVLVAAAGCTPTPDPAEPPPVSLFAFDEYARQALQSLGINREPVHSMHIPMALNRLAVVLGSLNSKVPDLSITLVETGTGWQLESPPLEDIADWLHRSK